MVLRCFYCTFWISLLYPYSMWNTFFYIFFVQTTITLVVKTISIKYNLEENITFFSSVAHGLFNVLTAQMVSDLNDTQNKKPKKSTF